MNFFELFGSEQVVKMPFFELWQHFDDINYALRLRISHETEDFIFTQNLKSFIK